MSSKKMTASCRRRRCGVCQEREIVLLRPYQLHAEGACRPAGRTAPPGPPSRVYALRLRTHVPGYEGSASMRHCPMLRPPAARRRLYVLDGRSTAAAAGHAICPCPHPDQAPTGWGYCRPCFRVGPQSMKMPSWFLGEVRSPPGARSSPPRRPPVRKVSSFFPPSSFFLQVLRLHRGQKARESSTFRHPRPRKSTQRDIYPVLTQPSGTL